MVSRSSLLSSSLISKDPEVTGTWRAQKLFLALSALEREPRAVGTKGRAPPWLCAEGVYRGCCFRCDKKPAQAFLVPFHREGPQEGLKPVPELLLSMEPWT